MCAELENEVKEDINEQIEAVLDKRVEVDHRLVAQQESMDRASKELSRMQLDHEKPGAAASASSGNPPQAKSTSARHAPAPSCAGSAGGINILSKVSWMSIRGQSLRLSTVRWWRSCLRRLLWTFGPCSDRPPASSFAVLFGTQDEALHFLREVPALPGIICFPIGHAEGDMFTFASQRNPGGARAFAALLGHVQGD